MTLEEAIQQLERTDLSPGFNLDVSECYIYDAGTIVLAKALTSANLPAESYVNISLNDIHDTGAMAIAGMLTSPNLPQGLHINISQNPCINHDNKGEKALANALNSPNLPQRLRIDISDNYFGNTIAENLRLNLDVEVIGYNALNPCNDLNTSIKKIIQNIISSENDSKIQSFVQELIALLISTIKAHPQSIMNFTRWLCKNSTVEYLQSLQNCRMLAFVIANVLSNLQNALSSKTQELIVLTKGTWLESTVTTAVKDEKNNEQVAQESHDENVVEQPRQSKNAQDSKNKTQREQTVTELTKRLLAYQDKLITYCSLTPHSELVNMLSAVLFGYNFDVKKSNERAATIPSGKAQALLNILVAPAEYTATHTYSQLTFNDLEQITAILLTLSRKLSVQVTDENKWQWFDIDATKREKTLNILLQDMTHANPSDNTNQSDDEKAAFIQLQNLVSSMLEDVKKQYSGSILDKQTTIIEEIEKLLNPSAPQEATGDATHSASSNQASGNYNVRVEAHRKNAFHFYRTGPISAPGSSSSNPSPSHAVSTMTENSAPTTLKQAPGSP